MKAPLIGSLWLACGLVASGGLDHPVVESIEVQQNYARGGDPGAQYNLGLAYARGQVVPKDPVKAFNYFKAAAEQGLPEAEYNLAICYLYGAGVAKDEKLAVRWCTAAARQGKLAAQTLMMRNYLNGVGVAKSPVLALSWDFMARRTLTLRKGGAMGAPPLPAVVRPDGAVEVMDPNGNKVLVHPDQGRETPDGNGSRTITYTNGSQTTITPDGVRETRMPGGHVEWRMPDGTQILMNAQGATRAQFPDGRLESKSGQGATQTVFPDGAKVSEGPGTSATGETVQVRESIDAQGHLKYRRIAEKERTVEVRPDQSFNVEFVGEDAEGHALTLIESYSAQGNLLGRDLVKPDGTHRTGMEEWTIVRWYRDPGNQRIHVRETYGPGGSTVHQEVLARETVPPVKSAPLPAPRTEPIVFVVPSPGGQPMGRPTSGARAGVPPGDAETGATLDALAELETLSRNFAGVTAADYKAKQAQAAQYVIPYENPPQKPELKWTNIKTTRLVAPPQPRLEEIPTDLSKKYPFGQNGQEAIKVLPWKHAESDHFVVHYTDLATAAPVMHYIESAYCVVVQLLQVEEAKGAAKSHVFVFPNRKSWSAWLDDHKLPPEVAGYAYKGELLFGAGQEKDEYVKTICHEATHAILARYYPGRPIPLWFNEGLAEYSAARAIALKRGGNFQKFLRAGPIDHDLRPVFARKGYQDAPPPAALPASPGPAIPASAPGRISQPATPLAEIEKLRTFYRTSERCVTALNEHVESANFPKFVNLLIAGNPADVALRTAYGKACDSPEALAKLLDP